MNENTLNEQSMLQAGADRYVRNQAKAKEHDQLTSAENKVFTDAVGKVASAMQAALEEQQGPGRKPAWFNPISELGSLQCAVIALRLTFNAVGDRTPFTQVVRDIGRQIEVELIAEAVRRAAPEAAQAHIEEKGLKGKEARDYLRAAMKEGEKLYTKLVKKASKFHTLEFKTKVFSELAQEEGFWSPTDADEQVKTGSGLFNFVQQSTDIFEVYTENEGNPNEHFMGVRLTEAAAARLDSIAEVEAWMHPVYKPMLTKPKDWVTAFTGCYEEQKLAATVPVIRSINKKHTKEVDGAIRAGAPFAQALNAIQAVPLQANMTVAHYMEWASKAPKVKALFKAKNKALLKGFPAPKQEIEETDGQREMDEKKKFNAAQVAMKKELQTTLTLADEYVKYGRFYLPSALDWRSRVYAKPHLNHQREDSAKALFMFDEGQVLTPEGRVWLAIHLCNSAAFSWKDGKKWDKAPLDQRYQWTVDNTARICEMVKDPTKDLWWVEADSPFMFLAACEAWAGVTADPEGYICRLPVGVDGSCSGLQHFSAMLRDPIGGSHVNLTPQDSPADVYQVVADVVKPLVDADAEQGNAFALRWLKATGITRKVAKRCVMTYVYGSKQYGFAEHLAEDFHKEVMPLVIETTPRLLEEKDWEYAYRLEREHKATAFYLAKHIWNAVQDTVKAAAAAMQWLQETAGLLASKGMPLTWTTPSGFPVINAYYKPQIERVELTLWDRAMNLPKRVVPSVLTGVTKELVPAKCRSSIAPNFVHSLDAAHLHLAVLKAQQEGIKSVMLIHDSFSCLPNDMPRFSQIVRETFVEMYEQNDPLNDIYEYAKSCLVGDDEGLQKLAPPPTRGTLDLQLVLESHYAFA